MKPKWWNKAKKQLSERDIVMKKLLSVYKGHLTTRNNFFYSLTRSIISQQISVSAADSVFSKFEKKCRGKINPKIVSKLSITDLRRCGLSRMKALGIKSLAKLLIPNAFILLRPHLLRSVMLNFDTIFGFILPLHFFSNFEKTESAAETEICCEIIDLVKE